MRALILGAVLVSSVSAFAGIANAAPPPDGWNGSYKSLDGSRLVPVIVCSSKEKVHAIFDEATAGGFEKASAKAMSFYKADGSCQLDTLSGVTVHESDDLGEVIDREQTDHFWSVHIVTEKGDRFVLYKEHVVHIGQTAI
jgi:hypothetical protein